MSQKLLLHTCCAPCLSGCLHQLPADCTVVSYFFNPNITIPTEHAARLGELRRYAAIGGFDCIVEDSGKDRWQKAIHPLRDLGERSERGELCYRIRLEHTCIHARDNGYSMFGTTLTVSPYKMTGAINRIGQELAETYGVAYLVSDFKKKNGYRISIENSRRYSFYRQTYCGCVYSKHEREKATAAKRTVSV